MTCALPSFQNCVISKTCEREQSAYRVVGRSDVVCVCVCGGGVDKDNVVFLCGEKEVFRVLKTLKHKLKQASKFLFLVNGESQGKDEEGLPVIWMQSTTQTQKPVWLLHARLSCMTSDACVRILI